MGSVYNPANHLDAWAQLEMSDDLHATETRGPIDASSPPGEPAAVINSRHVSVNPKEGTGIAQDLTREVAHHT